MFIKLIDRINMTLTVKKSCEDEQFRDDSEPLFFFWWTFLIESTIKTGDVQDCRWRGLPVLA